MTESTILIKISDSIGKVSAKVIKPAKPKAAIVVAHGAGAGMDHPFMKSLCEELEKLSIATLRFNFPFTQNKKNRPDPPAVAEKTVEMVVTHAHGLFPKLPLFASGKSFGGRMTSQRFSKECPGFVNGIIFFGFPLHAPGSPGIERAAHLADVKVPMLFLQGTRDALADLKLMEKVVKKLKAATMVTFEKADHSFKAGKENLIPKLAAVTTEWISRIMGAS